MMTKTCNFCGCYSGHEGNCPRAIAERRGERFDDLAHLRAASDPKDDMIKRETPLPKASAVCPVCGLDRPHGHGQEELITLIVSLKAERDEGITRMHTAINMLDAGHTKEQVRVWLEGYCYAAKEK